MHSLDCKCPQCTRPRPTPIGCALPPDYGMDEQQPTWLAELMREESQEENQC